MNDGCIPIYSSTIYAYFHQLKLSKTTQCFRFEISLENLFAIQPEVK